MINVRTLSWKRPVFTDKLYVFEPGFFCGRDSVPLYKARSRFSIICEECLTFRTVSNGVKISRYLHRFYVDPGQPRRIRSYIQKTETISDLRFSAPLGARTLDPNIKSVVLYQLS